MERNRVKRGLSKNIKYHRFLSHPTMILYPMYNNNHKAHNEAK